MILSGDQLDYAGAHKAYREAFAAAGLTVVDGNAQAAAEGIAASPIRNCSSRLWTAGRPCLCLRKPCSTVCSK